MTITLANNAPIKYSARTHIRNENTFAIKVDEAGLINTLLSQLDVAKGSILIGIHYPQNDAKVTATLSDAGSSAAVKKFTKACEIKLGQVATAN